MFPHFTSIPKILFNKILKSPVITNKSSTGTDSGTENLANKTLTSPLFQGSIDGWTNADESWSYASATTITVPSGAASKYQKGDKWKLTANSVVLQGYIIGVADTLLTVVGDALTNHAFTANYYSKAANPQGFPGSFALTTTSKLLSIKGNIATVWGWSFIDGAGSIRAAVGITHGITFANITSQIAQVTSPGLKTSDPTGPNDITTRLDDVQYVYTVGGVLSTTQIILSIRSEIDTVLANGSRFIWHYLIIGEI